MNGIDNCSKAAMFLGLDNVFAFDDVTLEFVQMIEDGKKRDTYIDNQRDTKIERNTNRISNTEREEKEIDRERKK